MVSGSWVLGFWGFGVFGFLGVWVLGFGVLGVGFYFFGVEGLVVLQQSLGGLGENWTCKLWISMNFDGAYFDI